MAIASYGVFSTDAGGNMKWLATLDTLDAANEVADETMLRIEQAVMVIPLGSFRQEDGLVPVQFKDPVLKLGEKSRTIPFRTLPDDAEGEFQVWIFGNQNDGFHFADVTDVREGRMLWQAIAGLRGVDLHSFQIKNKYGSIAYEGNYTNDEC